MVMAGAGTRGGCVVVAVVGWVLLLLEEDKGLLEVLLLLVRLFVFVAVADDDNVSVVEEAVLEADDEVIGSEDDEVVEVDDSVLDGNGQDRAWLPSASSPSSFCCLLVLVRSVQVKGVDGVHHVAERLPLGIQRSRAVARLGVRLDVRQVLCGDDSGFYYIFPEPGQVYAIVCPVNQRQHGVALHHQNTKKDLLEVLDHHQELVLGRVRPARHRRGWPLPAAAVGVYQILLVADEALQEWPIGIGWREERALGVAVEILRHCHEVQVLLAGEGVPHGLDHVELTRTRRRRSREEELVQIRAAQLACLCGSVDELEEETVFLQLTGMVKAGLVVVIYGFFGVVGVHSRRLEGSRVQSGRRGHGTVPGSRHHLRCAIVSGDDLILGLHIAGDLGIEHVGGDGRLRENCFGAAPFNPHTAGDIAWGRLIEIVGVGTRCLVRWDALAGRLAAQAAGACLAGAGGAGNGRGGAGHRTAGLNVGTSRSKRDTRVADGGFGTADLTIGNRLGSRTA
ncbi:hypothetical protein PG985_013120 [Apiospora marii]|uniref:uncharacterized protein n=1 Tax=Apiospora marii TaxID=335849 RepID=UPI00312D352D